MKVKGILFGLIAFVLSACSDEVKVENMSGYYPMNIGTTWNYEYTSYFTTYDSAGKFQQLSHSVEQQTTVITKDTVVNGIVLRQFVTTLATLSGPVHEVFYYRQDTEGLKEYGYSVDRGSWTDVGIIDSTSQAVKQSFLPHQKAKTTTTNNLYMYPQPQLLFAYPLSVNSEWYPYSKESGNRKQVVEKDTLQIGGKTYPCFKIETTETTEYEYYYEWVSTAGILKIESQTVMNDVNPGDSTYGQSKEHVVKIAKSLH